jgi:hypothetical protein
MILDRLVQVTARAVYEADPTWMPAWEGPAAETAVLALPATRMMRVRLADGTRAHARDSWRGGGGTL